MRLSRNFWYGLEILSKTLRLGVGISKSFQMNEQSLLVPRIHCRREIIRLRLILVLQVKARTHLAQSVSPPLAGSSFIFKIA